MICVVGRQKGWRALWARVRRQQPSGEAGHVPSQEGTVTGVGIGSEAKLGGRSVRERRDQQTSCERAASHQQAPGRQNQATGAWNASEHGVK